MAETTINNPQLPPNATKFYTHFLYKAVFVSIFILILPLFPSQAPDFINHKTINTTSWEFLQLVFVGIAVSYGLFSKRNDENHKEEASSSSSFKSENAQSYVARLLQVSSVFDDDSENPSASGSHDKVQTWNSQYYRGEPIVVVAKESDDATTIEKPLLLPVRSLKTGVSESSGIDSKVNSFSRSNSRRISRNLSKVNAEESEENVVLRSPIPWRSRSGRMEVKEKEDFSQTPSVHENSGSNPIESPSFRYQFSKDFSQTPSVHDYSEANPIESPSFRYQFSKLSKQNLNPSSEDKIHPSSATLSSEIQSRSLEDVGRRKITPKSTFSPTPPPPPPPPPPPRQQRTVNVNVNHTHTHTNTRTNTHVNKELKRNVRSVPEEFQNRGRRAAEFTIRSRSGASLKTRKESELEEYLSHDKEIERFIERRGSQSKKFMDDDEDDDEMENPEEEKKKLMKDLDDGEKVEEELESIKNESDNGPDVDKKADEFIAKFREQIRLQRIASIRKSTAQR